MERFDVWLATVPRLVAECTARWQLRVGERFADGNASVALAASLPDGTEAVLKIQFPHRENEHEAAALAHWNGEGAVRLLAHDDKRHALLLERCRPGTPLSELEPDAALDVLIELLPRLWKPAGAPFRPLAEETAWWAGYLPDAWERAGRPCERTLLDSALDALAVLPGSQGERVLLQQDLHADNVLSAQREQWLVIDPKPLVGEREFAVAPIVRSPGLGHSREATLHRLERLTTELDLDRDRARVWTIAQTMAWAFDGNKPHPRHLETVRWLLEDSR